MIEIPTVKWTVEGLGEGGGEILSFTRALRANPVAKAGSLSPLKVKTDGVFED